MEKRKHPLAKCEECPLYERGRYVPPDGRGKSKYVFIGEAPGATEAKKGKPFIGISGKLLDELLKGHEIKRHEGTYTNACLCRPPNNAVPPQAALDACRPAMLDTVERADPDYVVTLGKTATASFLEQKPDKVKITKERVGPPRTVEGKTWKHVPTIHPAACLRNQSLFPQLDKDIGKLNQKVQIRWEPPKFKVYDGATQTRLAIGQLLQRTRTDKLVIDLEVGEDKDEDFGHPDTLLEVGIGYEPGKAIVIEREALASRQVREDLSKLFKAKKLVCHNGKYDLGVLHRMGFGTYKLEADTMLMAYTQNETRGGKGLKYLGQEELGTPDWSEATKEYKKFIDIPPDILSRYNAYDVAVTWDLMEMFEGRMDSDDQKLHDYLCWVSDQLMIIESEGIYIDLKELEVLDTRLLTEWEEARVTVRGLAEEYYDKFDERIKRLIKANEGFNPNSVDQVRAVLEQSLEATVTTTDADMLESLANHKSHAVRKFAEAMLDFRQVGKLYGTYIKGTRERLMLDGRLMTTFLLHGTETGRLSSRNPNVQNVPRTTQRANIRAIYAASPGNKIIYGDYSNIEGRIVAIESNSESMIEQINSGEKIHNIIAKEIYGNGFDDAQYTAAKTVVHGSNYARTPAGIAQGLGIPLAEAQGLWSMYHGMFPEVKQWHADIKHTVLETDDILKTPWGRKRRFHLITRDNAEDVFKEGLAFKPQSIGNDICLTAATKLREEGYHVRLLIHDGIAVECPEAATEDTVSRMRTVMEAAALDYTDRIKFPVDFKVGNSWGETD